MRKSLPFIPMLAAVAVSVLGFALPTFAQTADETPLPANGSLLKAESGDPRVFYIENGLKRWIRSGEAFSAQDFHWADVASVPASTLARFFDGEPITAQTILVLPSEQEVLPDLIPFAARDISYDVVNGRKVLRFTTIFWNAGRGKFELVSRAPATPTTSDSLEDTRQHIVSAFGTSRAPLVGSFLWHATHRHYHYLDFADYILEPVGTNGAVGSTQKTSFCMRDDLAVNLATPGAPGRAFYGGCTNRRQGVSVGWADRYGASLPDQYVDVQDLPAGLYRLVFDIDPASRFIEKRRDNNVSVTLIQLDPAKNAFTVIASGAPYVTERNTFPDGMLVRGDVSSTVYVMHGNRRRALTAEAFASYGYDANLVRVFPQAVIDAVPRRQLIRQSGTGAVYLINEHGYRRHIRSLGVLASYGGGFVDVNKVDFDSYRDSNLLMRAGEKTVYVIEGGAKREFGPFDSLAALGRDGKEVLVASDADFHFYASPKTSGFPTPDPNAVQVIADGLSVPWDLAFLPDGDMLVTERTGTLRRIGKNPTTIALPSIPNYGEGGLMGMALHPRFAENNFVYLYYTVQLDGKRNRVSRFTLDGDRLIGEKVIIDGIPASLYHDGGQIAFGPDGMLYVTTGDASTPAYAQNTGSLAGKTLRVTPEGGVPAGNPFGHRVWSYGHRNAQGLAWDDRGRLWETEHGRSGALSGYDELNLIVKGGNYGWPTIQGDQTADGMLVPARHSGPDVTWAPSGIAFVDGSLFFTGLRGSAVYEAVLDAAGKPGAIKTHLKDAYGRLRAMAVGPDGYLYFTTSNRDGRGTPKQGDDKILRASPAYVRAH